MTLAYGGANAEESHEQAISTTHAESIASTAFKSRVSVVINIGYDFGVCLKFTSRL